MSFREPVGWKYAGLSGFRVGSSYSGLHNHGKPLSTLVVAKLSSSGFPNYLLLQKWGRVNTCPGISSGTEGTGSWVIIFLTDYFEEDVDPEKPILSLLQGQVWGLIPRKKSSIGLKKKIAETCLQQAWTQESQSFKKASEELVSKWQKYKVIIIKMQLTFIECLLFIS